MKEFFSSILLFFLAISAFAAENKGLNRTGSDDEPAIYEHIPFGRSSSLNLSDMLDDLLPTVVSVTAVNSDNYTDAGEGYYEQDYDRSGQTMGSGFIISDDGYIVTNYHVIKHSESVLINLKGSDTNFPANIVGVDEIMDIALLKVNLKSKLPYAEFEVYDNQKIGDHVLIIGNPYNLGLSVSTGIISALNRSLGSSLYGNFIQTDASINKGSSGGPMFDLNRKVIGVTSSIYAPDGSGSSGIGFAIPASDVLPIVEQLKRYGHVRRGWVGFTLEDANRDVFAALGSGNRNGALVVGVHKGGPADRAGIVVSDIITSFDGRPVKKAKDLSFMIASTEVGSGVKVGIWRNNTSIGKVVTVEESKGSSASDQGVVGAVEVFDMYVTPVTREVKKRYRVDEDNGLLIVKIKKNGVAHRKGLRSGDVILYVNQTEVKSLKDLEDVLRKSVLNNSSQVFLIVKSSDGRNTMVMMQVKEITKKTKTEA